MSSLNNEAMKALMIEEDVLSSSGTIQGIWDLYVKNVNFQNHENDILKVILKSLESNVINHLSLSDEELESCVTSFVKMVDEVCTGMSQNEVAVFLIVLAHALSEYSSIKSETLDNIQINMENVSEMSQIDGFKIMSAMERYGLLDSAELQSLLDEGNLAVTTACTDICHRWGKGSPSDNEGSDAKRNPLLSLKDFLPKLDEIFLKAREMFVWKNMITDNFPDIVSSMQALIMPRDDFDGEWFYQQGTYLANLANLRILTATAQFVCSILDLDTTTALYILSLVDDKINYTMDQIGRASSLLFSQLITSAMTIRYLIRDGGEDSPNTTILVNKMRNRLAELVHILDDQTESFVLDEVVLFRKSQTIDEYVSFVAFAAAAEETASATDGGFSEQELTAAMDELLSGVEEVRMAVMDSVSCGTGVADSAAKGMLGVLSSLDYPSVEQTPRGKGSSGMIGVAVECGVSLHNELNQSLMDGNFENAANALAKEIAFEQEMLTVKEIWGRPAEVTTETVQSVVERVQLDISTYWALLEKVPGGIAKYQQSASDYVAEMLRANVPT